MSPPAITQSGSTRQTGGDPATEQEKTSGVLRPPKTTAVRAPLFFLLCSGILLALVFWVNGDFLAKVLAAPAEPGVGLQAGQMAYLAVSMALCLTVFVFGAGPASQHGRWAGSAGWIPSKPEPDDKPEESLPREDEPEVTETATNGTEG